MYLLMGLMYNVYRGNKLFINSLNVDSFRWKEKPDKTGKISIVLENYQYHLADDLFQLSSKKALYERE